ncbi:caspase family protein [Burkholderia ubonensis]|uniref:caspase family protein n=1 Tax=Burkholderia ubonensis TaxID=101571 RepID=UPI00076D2504|nr:NACHT domain-containing protein [Burkholderia ubonensis]KVC74847.1 hypothetical protein WI74_18085 [Burkholderia ubonensis]
MPSPAHFDGYRRRLIAAGTAHFQNFPELPRVEDELKCILSAFAELGYETQQGALNPDHEQLGKLFADACEKCTDQDLVVAYYTGHGEKAEEDRFYLVTSDSAPNKLHRTALAADDLARAMTIGSRAKQTLVILDVCYAGAGAAEFTKVAGDLTKKLKDVAAVYVIAAARPKQEAEQGALSAALTLALANPDERLGGRTQKYLAPDEIIGAVNDYLLEKHPAQKATLAMVNVVERCCLFPNLRHRPAIQSGLDLAAQQAALAGHWVLKARGAEFGAGGWYFTGRQQALREVAQWLSAEQSGALARVVTGGPGCGKSAVLARVVTLADPTYLQEVLATSGSEMFDSATLPPEGVVNVAVHARRKLLSEIAEQIAAGLGLAVRDPAALVQVLASRPQKTVIVVDALDEADDKDQIASRLLRPLAELPQVFLLVGTRPDSSEHGRRVRALGESTVEIDLDDPRYVGDDDVSRYVKRRLLAVEEPARRTPYRDSPEIARIVAEAVAERARNVFLVAHTAVQALLAEATMPDVTRPSWVERLPTGLDEAFEQFLVGLDSRPFSGLSSVQARAVLLPLAYAEGEGLPWADLWAVVATALSDLDVSDADIRLVREHAAAFIVEAAEQERSVYRLYHERLAEHLRSSVADLKDAHFRIFKALLSRVPKLKNTTEPDWTRAHPYLLTHLAAHALAAGTIDELVANGTFITVADPLRTLAVLAAAKEKDPLTKRVYACYSLAFDRLRDQPPDIRWSYLEMTARQRGDEELAGTLLRSELPRRWAVPWARWTPVTPHRTIWVGEPITSVVLGTLDGRPLIVAGRRDGVIEAWDLASGEPRGAPLQGHVRAVLTVALGTLDGQPVIVSGGSDGTVRVWDMATGTPRGVPLEGHQGPVNAVALGTLGGQPVIVSGADDGTVRVWDPATGRPHSAPLHGHEGWINAVALGALDGQPVIVSGGLDGTVRVWELATGTPRGTPLKGHQGPVSAVAVGTLDDRPVIVSGGRRDGTVRVWDLATGTPRSAPLLGHEQWVSAVAVDVVEGRPVIVSSGRRDGKVRVWDLASGTPQGAPLQGHERGVIAVALGTLHGRPIIVSSGEDGTVRVWDFASGTPRGYHGPIPIDAVVALGAIDGRPVIASHCSGATVQAWDLVTGTPCSVPLRDRTWWTKKVALGTLNDRPVVVVGASDRVEVWDLAMGTPSGVPLEGHQGPVSAVALGTLGGQPVIVSGADDGTVQAWDPATGRPHSAPLHGHEGWINAVALGTLGGQPVIVSGGSEGTVRVWDLAMGTPRGVPLKGHQGPVSAVAVGTLDDRPVIVSGGEDGTVRVWNVEKVAISSVRVGSRITHLAFVGPGTVVVATVAGLLMLEFNAEAMVRPAQPDI